MLLDFQPCFLFLLYFPVLSSTVSTRSHAFHNESRERCSEDVMSPFLSDIISDTAVGILRLKYATSSVEEESALKMLPAIEEEFMNLTEDIMKLSTVAAYAYDDDYFDTNYTDFYRPVSARIETFVMSGILGLIFVVGVLGNGTLIAIFLRHRGMRNIPNT